MKYTELKKDNEEVSLNKWLIQSCIYTILTALCIYSLITLIKSGFLSPFITVTPEDILMFGFLNRILKQLTIFIITINLSLITFRLNLKFLLKLTG